MGLMVQDLIPGRGQEVFLFSEMSRLILQLTMPPVKWVPGVFSQEVRWPGHEADHLVPRLGVSEAVSLLPLHV
jgi:hypothetical protein